MKIRILNSNDVKKSLPMKTAIEETKRAFSSLSSKKIEMPLRSRINVPKQDGVLLTMPAALLDDGDIAVKIVSVFGNNLNKGLPLIHAIVIVLDALNGKILSLMDGEVLTAIRTGAGVGVATDFLAPQNAKIVSIIGSGVQARSQLEAVCTIRNIKHVRVYSPNIEHSKKFAKEMSGVGKIPSDVKVFNSSEEALKDSDIICTATNSMEPVISFDHLKNGAHVNAVGSFQPSMQEIDAKTISRSLVIVDSFESALVETGDIKIPLDQGLIKKNHIFAEIGEIINGTKKGRLSSDQLTFFKSCGVAVQDAVTAGIALKNAERKKLGTVVSL